MRWCGAPPRNWLAIILLAAIVLAGILPTGSWPPATWIESAGGSGLAHAAETTFRAFAPGHERDLLSLIAPLQMDGEVAGGRLSGLQVDRNQIAWEVTSATGETARLLWTARPATGAAAVSGLPPSASFALQTDPSPPPQALLPALQELAARVRHNDQGGWIARLTTPLQIERSNSPPAAPQTQASAPAAKDHSVAVTGWLALAAMLWLVASTALAWVAIHGWRSRATAERWWTLLGLAAIAVVAFAVRGAVPATLLHCNNHGLEDLRAVLGDDAAGWSRLVLRYGPAWFGPQALLARLGGSTDAAVFAASTGWGTVATVLTATAAWLWHGSYAAAALAGLWMALMPLAVRVGHSESTLVVGQCAVALVLLAAGLLRRSRAAVATQAGGDPVAGPPRALAWTLLCCALVIIAAGHTFGPGYAMALWLLVAEVVVAAAPGVSRWQAGLRWLAVAALPVVIFLALLLGSDASNRSRLAAATLSEASPFKPWQHLLWLDGGWTPWAAQALAGLGLVRLVAAGPRLRWLTLPAGLGLLVGLALFIGGSLSVAMRYQSLLGPVLAWLAGGALLLPRAAPWQLQRLWRVATTGLALAALAGLAVHRVPYRWQDLEAHVFAALEPLVPTLPDGSLVLLPDREGTPDQEVMIDFPAFLARRSGRRLAVLHHGEWQRLQREAAAAPSTATFVWRSPHCQARARVVGRPPAQRDAEGFALRDVCAPLEALRRQAGAVTIARGHHPPPREPLDRLPDEYNVYGDSAVIWHLTRLPAAAPSRTVVP
jgi:hypothetical protein